MELVASARLTPLLGLESVEYEHPFDQTTLNALQGTPGLEAAIKLVAKYGLERAIHIEYAGSYFKATRSTAPLLYEILDQACEILYLPRRPDLFIVNDGSANAAAIGIAEPFISINSGTIERFTDEELLFIIGHEIGHLKSNHTLYHNLGSTLGGIGSALAATTFGFGELLTQGLGLALLKWDRAAELTADRAGLLACQDVDTACTALMKLAGISPRLIDERTAAGFLQQAREFTRPDWSAYDQLLRFVMTLERTHPWTVVRASELCTWVDSGAYEQVILRRTSLHLTPTLPSTSAFCTACGAQLAEATAFCTNCGGRQLH